MKFKLTFIVLLLIIASSPIIFHPTIGQSENGMPPSPIFESLNNTGVPAASHIYPNETGLTIRYKVDRFQVEGLFLVGSGSNLTENISDPKLLNNFTKVNSQRQFSYYEIELMVTSYTYFFAYSWFGEITNATKEEFEIFGDQPGHQLWIEEGKLYPDFDSNGINATLRGDEYYAPLGSTVEITYRVRNPDNDTNEAITLGFANNETQVLNVSLQIETVSPERVDYTQIGEYNFSIFKYNYTLDRAIVYFTAFNDHGWEREDATNPIVHKLTNGFSYNSTLSEIQNNISDIDKISFNFTTFNETANFDVGYRYRYFANESSEIPLQNWTMFTSISNTTGELVNSSRDGTLQINSTLKRVYNISIDQTFEKDTLIEIEPFLMYYGTKISDGITEIIVLDSSPMIKINSKNETITNRINGTVIFEFSTAKGEIDEATLDHILPSNSSRTIVDVKNRQNYTADFSFTENTTRIEGIHRLVINVSNTLGVFSSKTVVYYIDTTEPTGSIQVTNIEEGSASFDGIVEVSFSYADDGPNDQGVKYVRLHWGNNLAINATSLSDASMKYRRNGTYTIILSIFDKAGNVNNITTEVTVSILPPTTTETRSNPINIFPIITSLVVIAILMTHKRRLVLYNKSG